MKEGHMAGEPGNRYIVERRVTPIQIEELFWKLYLERKYPESEWQEALFPWYRRTYWTKRGATKAAARLIKRMNKRERRRHEAELRDDEALQQAGKI